MSHWIKDNRTAAFYITACLIAWSIAGLLIADRFEALSVPAWVHYTSGLGPALAAVLITALTDGGAGLRDLGSRLTRVNFKPVWWLVVLSPLALFALVSFIGLIVTGEAPSIAGLGNVDGIGQIGVLPAVLLWVATFGIGEETGWRGFAQHHLQQKHGTRKTALLVGVMWALWHWPFFFYDANFMAMGVVGAIGFSIGLIAGAVILAWVYNGTGQSILTVALWHALFNLAGAAPGSDVLVAPAMSMIVIIAAVALRNIERRQMEAPVAA